MLEVREVSKNFGGLRALEGVSFRVERGSIHALIGPNGAVKTTLFNIINGYLRPTSGHVHFMGKRIDGMPPSRIAMMGIARTFQLVQTFPDMTVLQNVLAGAGKVIYRSWRVMFESPKKDRYMKKAMEVLKMCGMEEYKDEMASSLPIGLQRKLEVARALATDPVLLLLDEPASGLNDKETEELAELILRIREMGITVFFIEHDMKFTMGIADVVTVLDYGKKIAQGRPEEVSKDPRVIEAYLGTESDLNA